MQTGECLASQENDDIGRPKLKHNGGRRRDETCKPIKSLTSPSCFLGLKDTSRSWPPNDVAARYHIFLGLQDASRCLPPDEIAV